MKKSPMKQTAVCAAALAVLSIAAAQADESAAPNGSGNNYTSDKRYTGMVASVDPQSHAFRLKGGWLMHSRQFDAADNCAYAMLDKNLGAFNDLRAGEKVTVNYRKENGVLIADRVEQKPMRFEGRVVAINQANHTLIVRHMGLDKTMQLSDDTVVRLHGNKPGTLNQVQTGNHVTVTYETPNDQPVAREIAKTSVSFTGKLTALDLNARTLKANAGFESKTFRVGDNCTIVAEGKTTGQLSDLRPDENLVFSYDDVNGVNVVNRIAPAPVNRNYVSAPASGYGPIP